MHIEGHINWTNTDKNLVTTGSVTCGSQTFDFATQDYLITNRDGNKLAIQGQTTNTDSALELYAFDGDGLDNVYLNFWGKGTPSDITTVGEALTVGYFQTAAKIYTRIEGTGTVRPLQLYTGANTDQLVLNIDGSNSMSGSLTVTNNIGATNLTASAAVTGTTVSGTGLVSGGALITGGNIGITADTDLLQLAENALTVNGSVTGGAVSATGNITSSAGYLVSNRLQGYDDADTFISFGGDIYTFYAGGVLFLSIIEALAPVDRVVFNDDGVDIDLRVEAVGQTHALFVQGSDGKVGVRDSAPGSVCDVTGDINTTENYKVDDVQVVGNRVIDERCDDAINSGDATTDGVIDSLRDAMITHGLIAAA